MQFDEAAERRLAFAGRNCQHQNIQKEYYLGAHTTDYVCSECGAVFLSRDEWHTWRLQCDNVKHDGSSDNAVPEQEK